MAEWRDVPGLGGKYQVTADGRIRLAREIKPVRQRQGYLTIQIFKPGSKRSKMMSLHRLVALTWVPNPHNHPIVNHLDGDRANPQASNLQWCTHSENVRHGYARGRTLSPTQRRNLAIAGKVSADRRRKMTPDRLRVAKARKALGELQQDIARGMRVAPTTLSTALNGKRSRRQACLSQ